jgi:uncharacterized protein DUF4157
VAGGRVSETLRSQLFPLFGHLLERARLHSGIPARLLTRSLGADAVVFGRRVFLSASAAQEVDRRSRAAMALLAHELTHVGQYRRHGIAPFLRRYLSEYVRQRLAGRSHAEAYQGISFEREAAEAERDVLSG